MAPSIQLASNPIMKVNTLTPDLYLRPGKHDIDISAKVARLFTAEDFDYYDKILVMDSLNHADVMRMIRNEDDRRKIDYLLNLVNEGANDEVPDPYYGGPSGFDKVYDMMDRACDRIVKDLL